MKSLSLRNRGRIYEHHKRIWARGSTRSEVRQGEKQRRDGTTEGRGGHRHGYSLLALFLAGSVLGCWGRAGSLSSLK
jgi:hypothetical protein